MIPPTLTLSLIVTASARARARARARTTNLNILSGIHEALCHSGIICLAHFVRTRNLPYSLDDLKQACSSYTAYAKLSLIPFDLKKLI